MNVRRLWLTRRSRLVLLFAALPLSGCRAPTVPSGAAPSTAAFFDATDFAGQYITSSSVLLGGESIYNGRIVFSNLPRVVVEGVLPMDLRLAQNKSTMKALHPVAMLFGHQTMTGWVFPGASTLPIGDDYHELILIVPFVQAQGKLTWHNYVVRMFVDDVSAMIGGNQFFGYRKVLAAFTETGGNLFDVSMVGSGVFTASLSGFGTWYGDSQADTTLANYRAAKTIFKMPILGTLTTYAGAYVCSYFDWNFQSARARSITSQHAVQQPFDTGIAAWVALGTISSVDQGAFEVDHLVWRLGSPEVCAF